MPLRRRTSVARAVALVVAAFAAPFGCGARTGLPVGEHTSASDAPDGSANGEGGADAATDGDGAAIRSDAACVPPCMAPLRPLTVAAGYAHSCAIVPSRGLRCWGTDGHGELGDKAIAPLQTRPVVVGGLGIGAIAVAASFGHTCAITAGRGVVCWGHNYFGELGTGAVEDRVEPANVVGLARVTSIAAGIYHSCAVRDDGSAACWGLDRDGQLGDGTTVNTASPVAVHAPPLVAMAAGEAFTCAITRARTVVCWGTNVSGQLGDGTFTSSSNPVDVQGLTDVVALSAGPQHACAVTSDGVVRCWGENRNGALGFGAMSGSPRPRAVSGVPGAARTVATSQRHTCAILEDANVACWGAGRLGDLGDGRGLDSYAPVVTAPIDGVPVAIASGEGHVCVITSDDHARCWGGNDQGQVGDGTTIAQRVPIAVDGL